jgi:thiamine phosphate synthase YjbQ (UPF0047 family)
MPILKYFLTVGLALTAGLFALSAYLESGNAAKATRTHTTASLAIVKPAAPAVESDLDVLVGPQKPDKPAKASPRHSTQSNRDARRAVH